MTAGSRILGALAKLPPARTHDVTVERDLEAKMADGAVLLADRWHPSRTSGAAPPVVLVRSPYGRRQLGPLGRLFAERGYQAVIQSCRGTFGSGGTWEPFRNEREDGRGTLEWLAGQPWFPGALATFGPSYLGLTQWSLLEDAPPSLLAVAPSVTASNFRDAVTFPGGSFALGTNVAWVNQVEHQELGRLRVLTTMATARRAVARATRTLPLADADLVAVGRHVDFFQDWLVHDAPGDPWWRPVDFGAGTPHAPPATLLGGWYDIFLPKQVADFEALIAAGRTARLTIGPWTHASPGGMAAAVRDGLDWFDTHLQGADPHVHGGSNVRLHKRGVSRREPVRIYVMGTRRWVDVPTWPPPADSRRWHLHSGGRLDEAAADASAPDRYRYDPSDPTPACGGASLENGSAGPKDQQRREQRADVLTYTSDPCVGPLTVMGPVTADLHLRSSLEHTDVFVRLCDVSPKGRSTNLSDGIVRLRPGDVERRSDGSFRLRIAMWPTANTFRPGHRVRLQVSGGAHPLFARNPGGGEALATATTLRAADHEVLHDPDHPSAVVLPVSQVAFG